MTSAVTLAQSASANITLNFKNRLINGDFEFWQRGAGPTFLTSGVYLADRWTCMGFQAARHQRVSVTNPVAGMNARFANRVGSSTVAEAAGGTRMTCDQKIENINCYDLAGQTVTYSFWIRFSAATVASVANSTNSAFGSFNSYLAASTTNTDAATSPDSIGTVVGLTVITQGNLPTTWTKITATATVPAGSNNVALRLGFGLLGSTANAGGVWYEVTELQLEEGSFATSFDKRPNPVELVLCQRYFEQIDYFERYTGPYGNVSAFTAFAYKSNPFKVSKRNTSYTVYQSNSAGASYASRTNNVVLFSPTPGGDYTGTLTAQGSYLNSFTFSAAVTNGGTGGTYTLWIDNEL